MAFTYPIHFAAQMREHLRALRKKRGLTQAQLGAQLGVSQARIAEIEANPGLVSLEQVLQLLSHLGSKVLLEERDQEDESADKAHFGRIELYDHDDDEESADEAQLEALEHPDEYMDEHGGEDEPETVQERLGFHRKKGSW